MFNSKSQVKILTNPMRHNCVTDQPILARRSKVKVFLDSLVEVLRVGGGHLRIFIDGQTAQQCGILGSLIFE
jgi:hypothetical protein